MIEAINNPSAERAVLNLCIKNIDNLIECSSSDLYAEHFGVKANNYIYSAICYLVEQENVKKIDSNILYTILSTNKSSIDEVNKIGGMSYLENLCEFVVAEDNLQIFIKQVKENSIKRSVFRMAEKIKEEVLTEKNSSEILNDTQKKILGMMLDISTEEKVYKVGSKTRERLKIREENPRDIYGYRIGWKKFDYYTQGLQNNDLIVIVGESKTGKSTLLENISSTLSNGSALPGLYIDTEVTDEEFEDRMLSLISGVPFAEIRNGMYIINTEFGLGEEKKQKVYDALSIMEANKLFHIYMPDFNIDKVNALIRKYKIQEDIKYAVFDYIKLPSEDVKNLSNTQEYQRLGFLTTCLKDMAGICDIPIITACQSNRLSIGNTEPDANNIGGSYRILQLATKLFFIRNKTEQEMINENFEKGNQKLHLKYQRNGEGDKEIDVQFDRAILRMMEV